jgi:hypothetical protein
MKLSIKDRLALRRIHKHRKGVDRRDEIDKKEGAKNADKQTVK